MYDELIERLRETSIDFGESDHVSVMMIEAADAIEQLQKTNDDRIDFLEFLFNHIQPNEMEHYWTMFHCLDVPTRGESEGA